MRAGFAEIDITPPPGTRKIGWLRLLVGESILDPLYARVCVLESEGERVAFIALDTLSISRRHVADIRRRIEQQHHFPGDHITITATHNHAGPAIVRIGDVAVEPQYVEGVTLKLLDAFGKALSAMKQAEIGFASRTHFEVQHNRRVLMRDGLVKTHGDPRSPEALCVEGPVDPELFVMTAREKGGRTLGCLINFTCHPTHNGENAVFSAGWPGVVADEMKRAGWPVPLFVNGALGNISVNQPQRGLVFSMQETGRLVAADAIAAVGSASYRDSLKLGVRSQTIQLPMREPNEEQVRGTACGAQRFVDPAIYDRQMPALLHEIREKKGLQPAEVHVTFIDEYALVGIPAEYFVELGLQIKEQSYPRRALIAGLANGMVGYVPTKAAFRHGGYETTFIASSKLAPEAADLLTETAIRLVRAGP